jgi:ABC-type nitrate/sulfonate/bicarbonate transport system ATPase subunit
MQIEVRDAGVTFGRRVIFKGLSAVFESHTATALVGPSGSGKSTLLSCIAGFQELTTGDVKFTSQSLRPSEPGVTWIGQGANALGHRSVLDNVLLGPLSDGQGWLEAMAMARTALDLVGLSGREGESAGRLSGGELQRLAFARGLAAIKPVLLADEPTANLDEVNATAITRLLIDLADKATVIVATHDPFVMSALPARVHVRGGA